MELRRLAGTHLEVSALGLDVSGAREDRDALDKTELERIVPAALELGLNFISVSSRADEKQLGRVLASTPREQYILATGVSDAAENTLRGIEESLLRLNVEYLDIVFCQVNEPNAIDRTVSEILPALQTAREAGKIGYAGISGSSLPLIQTVIDRTPGLLQTVQVAGRYTLQNSSLTTFMPYLKDRQLGLISTEPFGRGLLSGEKLNTEYSASPEIKQKCAEAAAHCRRRGGNIEKLALQFAVANPWIATTPVYAGSLSTLRRYVAWCHEEIGVDLLREVQTILRPVRDL